jgi:hypothetical protein
MSSVLLSAPIVGVAARYAEQIRELLALSETHRNAQPVAEASKASADHVQSQVAGPRGTVVDLRA